jgi:DNA-binding response OmpR family regulator
MSKRTILIVDRDKIVIDLLIGALSSNDLFVLGATSADEAARLLDSHAPDLLVIDPAIPNGIQVLQSVRSGGLKTKVVAVTASREVRDRVRAIDIEMIIERDGGLKALASAIRSVLGADVLVLGRDDSVHVLIAEDEEHVRDMLSEFLIGKGYTVSLAKNGREAIQQVQSDPALQIILLDVSMPEMGGLEALKSIMANDPHPDVIMITSVADREIAQQTLKTGAFDYILKPFNLDAVEASITACLSRAGYKKQKSWWKR